MATWSLAVLRQLCHRDSPRPERWTRGTVLTYTLGLSVLTGVLCGVFPLGAPRDGGERRPETRWSVAGPTHRRFEKVLVVAEVALAMVLLIGAGFVDSDLQPSAPNGRRLPRGERAHVADASASDPLTPNTRNDGILRADSERVRLIPGVVDAATRATYHSQVVEVCTRSTSTAVRHGTGQSARSRSSSRSAPTTSARWLSPSRKCVAFDVPMPS